MAASVLLLLETQMARPAAKGLACGPPEKWCDLLQFSS